MVAQVVEHISEKDRVVSASLTHGTRFPRGTNMLRALSAEVPSGGT